jgi:tetratricopeptide (TPR) repeat protein
MKSPMIVAALLLAASMNTWGGMEEDVGQVRQEWERIKYKVAAKEQEEAYEKLAKESARVVTLYPTRAEPAIWHGIIEASYAGAKGGLGGLSLARSAKKSLEQALTIDPRALDGSAYTSLGSLYYQVPGWPIGFGDDKRALEFLQKGLAVNPDGIDPNYFHGDFLFRTGDYAGAEQALRKALQAPPREGRQLADEGRRKEINELLEKVRERRR